MQEPGTISFASGAAGQSGDGMQANVTVTAGVVSDVSITAQGTNYKVGDVLQTDTGDIAGGSGFTYTINANNTGISSVTDISLTGQDYQVGDVLSVDDATVGGGGGSGFQFTVNNAGFATAATFNYSRSSI